MNPNEFLKSELLKHIPDIDVFCERNNIKRSTFDRKINTLHDEDIFCNFIFKKAGLRVNKLVEYEIEKI